VCGSGLIGFFETENKMYEASILILVDDTDPNLGELAVQAARHVERGALLRRSGTIGTLYLTQLDDEVRNDNSLWGRILGAGALILVGTMTSGRLSEQMQRFVKNAVGCFTNQPRVAGLCVQAGDAGCGCNAGWFQRWAAINNLEWKTFAVANSNEVDVHWNDLCFSTGESMHC